MGAPPMQGPTHVVLSFHQRDRRRAEALDRHLSLLSKQGLITLAGRHRVEPGLPTDAALTQALARAQIVLVLLSVEYLNEDIDLADPLRRHHDGAACVVPVLVRHCNPHQSAHPYATLPALPRSGRPISAYSDPEAAYAEVARAVEHLAAQLRAGQPPHLDLPAPGSAQALAEDREAQALFGFIHPGEGELACDRTRQWRAVLDHATAPGHCAILLPGAAGQGHEFFLMRVRTGLPRDPPREIVRVHFYHRPFPRFEREYHADLAAALGHCPEDRLRAALRQRLARGNLVLLHDAIDRPVDPAAVEACFQRWLPDLLGATPPGGALKCLQPVIWARGFFAGFFADRARRPLRRGAAASILDAVTRPRDRIGSRRLQVHRLDDLEDITAQHVREFCRVAGLPPEVSEKFVKDVMSGGETSSAAILKEICVYYPRYRQYLPGPAGEDPGAPDDPDGGPA